MSYLKAFWRGFREQLRDMFNSVDMEFIGGYFAFITVVFGIVAILLCLGLLLTYLF